MTKIFADGADLKTMLEMAHDPRIEGFTTNPSLLRKSGVTDYAGFARELLQEIKDKPISFEVLADDFEEMDRQAHVIAGWGENAVVKIPLMNTMEAYTYLLMNHLARNGVTINATAIMRPSDVAAAALAIGPRRGYVSVFAGRIADTGRDPINYMTECLELCEPYPFVELIWASPREVLNYYQAAAIGCHIITMPPDLIRKLLLCAKDLGEYSLETVKQFYEDGKASGLTL